MAKKGKSLSAPSKAVDPALDALFASSAGPVAAPPKSRYSALVEQKQRDAPKPTKNLEDEEEDEEEGDDEVLSEISEELDYGDEDEGEDEDETSDAEEEDEEADSDKDKEANSDAEDEEMEDASAKAAEVEEPKRERKRKRKDDHDDLEDKYMSKIAAEEEAERAEKRQKSDRPKHISEEGGDDDDDNESDVPVHESLDKDSGASDLEKAGRTVFLANVSTDAISSKASKKTLMAHLASVLDKDATPAETVESIRFRSVAFGGGSLPKRAAFITKSLMDATTKSANAYAVYSSAVGARKACSELNGSEVLGRHIRVDSVAHPSATDHRRCVFVGNLGFVDDETVLNKDSEGEVTQKKRNKVPGDVEEGLWRTFGTQGKVENVRVVRDPKTRVGKGFAYVQFYDGNDVESALLLDGKKFPPMLPRALRVTRAKDPRKTSLAMERANERKAAVNGKVKNTKYVPKATPEQQSMAGRAGKLLGRSAAASQLRGKRAPKTESSDEVPAFKTPQQVVYEGRRASSKDAIPKDLLGKKNKGKGKGKSGRPQNRSTNRAAAWRKSTK